MASADCVINEAHMKLGVTGSRDGLTPEQDAITTKLLQRLLPEVTELHHGDCVGSDRWFHNRALDKYIVIHPPSAPRWRAFCRAPNMYVHTPAPYLTRNRAIVDQSERIIATPSHDEDAPESKRSGTWQTIRYAVRCKRPIWIVMPDGEIVPHWMPE